MEVQKDFEELLALLHSKNAEFIIVGGYALAFHGAPRYTGDLDVYVKPAPENAARIMEALEEFGFGALGLKQEDFQAPRQIVQLGFPPVRIDIITSISGVSWDEAFDGSVEVSFGEVPVRIIGRSEFVRNKKAVGRTRDLADLEAIGGETD